MNQPKLILLISVLLIALVTDLWKRKIYNVLVLLGLLGGLAINIHSMGTIGVIFWLKGSLLALFVFVPLYVLRGMAAGDVKLMMVVGGIVGLPLIVDVMLYVYIAGGLIALLIVLFRKQGQNLLNNLKAIMLNHLLRVRTGVNLNMSLNSTQSVGKMPYAVAIFAGTLYALHKHNIL
ncbi:MAG: hypothetical protein B7X95_08095 [Methylophilaceae bacterium 17-44-8]|jgi:prepilin peptidase CpaA|nr:MAG: hypothetical protein B7X95_08095 [Methylophilaceae bacterium 17-44-8]